MNSVDNNHTFADVYVILRIGGVTLGAYISVSVRSCLPKDSLAEQEKESAIVTSLGERDYDRTLLLSRCSAKSLRRIMQTGNTWSALWG